MPANIGYAAKDATSPLEPFEFDRGPVGAEDVRIDITHCGVCHSDIHQARDELGGALATNFPSMPGHEIVGTVTEVGDSVSRYQLGDRVGVGCMVYWGAEDHRGVEDEQYQSVPPTLTYNVPDPETGQVTFGGYSDQIVVNEHFVLRIPDSIPSEKAAPLLCAGVTTWAPLKQAGVGAGDVVAVAGLGGLGHLAIQLAKARGVEKVVALTTSPEKKDLALRLGADQVVDMNDSDAAGELTGSVDFLLSTIPTAFDMNPYLTLLRPGGTLHTVGMLEPVQDGSINFGLVSMKRLSIKGSLIGNIAETQEVLDFCAEHGISADVQVIAAEKINEAFDRVVDEDVEFRFVIDSSTLRSTPATASA